MLEQPECIFCRIASGALGTVIVAQNEGAVAFRDLDPQAPVHTLVISRRHIGSLAEQADTAELGSVLALAGEVARTEGLEGGFRTVINTGRDGGQTVPHLHAHVLGGRRMAWPPG